MTTITSKNYDKIMEFCDKAYALGANYIYFIEYMKQGNATNIDEDLMLNSEMRESFFKQLNLVRKKYDINDLNVTRCGNFGLNPYTNNKNFKCPAYKDLVVMTPDYKIYPCNFLINKENEIGYYKDGKIYIDDNYDSCCSGCLYCEKILKNNKS